MSDTSIIAVDRDNLSDLQVVLASVLPIPYPGAFYKSITREGTRRYGLLAQKDGKWMGAIVWEVEPSGSSIHILALAVLLGYRRKGVASLLLEQISVQSQLPITVEVQTENSEALAFYHSLGFSLVETLENYYRRVSCTGAHRLKLAR